ncbi:MAG: hypothetical protein HY720_09990 [Planctomycetes bacterium]|nr:hypothetical protein [Planctomycetota bacterium]
MTTFVRCPAIVLALAAAACSKAPEPERPIPVDRNPIPGLSGEIETSAPEAGPGETIEVVWYLRNRGETALSTDLLEGSREPGRPWQDFRFNTADIEAPTRKLDLVPPGPTPLAGPLEIPAGGRVEFARATLLAQEPGRYEITGLLDWVKPDVVEFEPVTVLVVGADSRGAGTRSGIDPEMEAEIGRMGSPDSAVAEVARESILARGEAAVPALLAHLDDPDERVQNRCLQTLLDEGLREVAVPHARRLLADLASSPEARGRAAYLVATVGGADEAAFIAGLAGSDPAPSVRRMAIALLAHGKGTPPDVAIQAYLGGLEDPDEGVRKDAFRAIQQETGETNGYDPAAPENERAAAVLRWREWWKARAPEEGG